MWYDLLHDWWNLPFGTLGREGRREGGETEQQRERAPAKGAKCSQLLKLDEGDTGISISILSNLQTWVCHTNFQYVWYFANKTGLSSKEPQ